MNSYILSFAAGLLVAFGLSWAMSATPVRAAGRPYWTHDCVLGNPSVLVNAMNGRQGTVDAATAYSISGGLGQICVIYRVNPN